MKIEFKEEQKFKQWWLFILIPIGIVPLIGIYMQVILGEDFGDKSLSDVGLVLFALFIFALIGLFLIMKLNTSIDEHGIEMSFFPFTKKKVLWNEIKNIKVTFTIHTKLEKVE